jgi:hypothetical protein
MGYGGILWECRQLLMRCRAGDKAGKINQTCAVAIIAVNTVATTIAYGAAFNHEK